LRGFLKRLLRLDRPPVGYLCPPETVALLEARLVALEEIQTRRELEWQETKEQLDRYLRRLTAREQRQRERDEAAEPTGKPDVARLLGMKFPNRGA